MIRWYRGHLYKGDPENLIKEVSQLIQNHDLSESIPLLRLQKGAKKGDYFYFFIAINSEIEGIVPPVVESVLHHHRFFQLSAVRKQPNYPFSFDKIKSMVGNVHDVRNYTREIPYNIPELQLPSVDKELSKRYDDLLFWLSFVKIGNFNSFKNTCEILQLESEARKIQRRLKLLAHIKVSPDGKQWEICPATLVEISPKTDYREFILCGQRSPKLIATLKQYTDLQIEPNNSSPSRISIKIPHSQDLSSMIQQVNQQVFLTMRSTEALPSLLEWQQTLKEIQGIESYLYDWEKFNGKEFEKCTFQEKSGFYQYQPKENENFSKKPIFYDDHRKYFLQSERYGLRFLALQCLNQPCYAHYEANQQQFAIRTLNRIPEIYEQALVLCSGVLPTEQNDWLSYEQVPSELAKELVNKLNLQQVNNDG